MYIISDPVRVNLHVGWELGAGETTRRSTASGQNFNSGSLLYRRVNTSSRSIIAEAVKFVKVGSQP